jgi:hypothetical protein
LLLGARSVAWRRRLLLGLLLLLEMLRVMLLHVVVLVQLLMRLRGGWVLLRLGTHAMLLVLQPLQLWRSPVG